MENENQNELNQEIPQPMSVESKKSKFNPKVIIIGLPLFIIQLIVVYYVTANILMKKMDGRAEITTNTIIDKITEDEKHAEETSHSSKGGEPSSEGHFGEHIFQLEDMIVNPANTAGNTLLLSSIAFDVSDEAAMQELEKKEILVKDLVISILSSKSLTELSSNTFKDSLRMEISDKVQSVLGDVNINRVYFSKYILN